MILLLLGFRILNNEIIIYIEREEGHSRTFTPIIPKKRKESDRKGKGVVVFHLNNKTWKSFDRDGSLAA